MSDVASKSTQPKRPGIATAAGIILIVFCSMCILSGLLGILGAGLRSVMGSITENAVKSSAITDSYSLKSSLDMMEYYNQNMGPLLLYYSVLLAAGIMGLVGGIYLMTSRQRGLLLSKVFSCAQIGLAIWYIILQVIMMQSISGLVENVYSGEAFSGGSLPPGFGSSMTSLVMGISYLMMVLGTIIGLAVPILVLIFATRKKVVDHYSLHGR